MWFIVLPGIYLAISAATAYWATQEGCQACMDIDTVPKFYLNAILQGLAWPVIIVAGRPVMLLKPAPVSQAVICSN